MDTLVLGVQGQNSNMILNILITIQSIAIIVYLVQYIICQYFIQTREYMWIEQTIFFLLQIIAILCHLGGKYYLADIFVDTDIYDEYYQEVKINNQDSNSDTNNLILIYVEQMENTYADKENGGYFETNYIPKLTELAKENIIFSNTDKTLGGAVNTSGCDLTSGGLIGTSIGLPLHGKVAFSLGQGIGGLKLFKNVDSLGDILSDSNYYNEFLCGTDTVFGSRKAYYETHSYDKILGAFEIRDNEGYTLENINNFEGINDKQLFEIAKQELNDITTNKIGNNEFDKFNFTIMTLDTHFPGEYRCENCGTSLDDGGYGDVLNCVDSTVQDFVEWCKTQEWYEDTTIVITGDHTYMIDSEFLEPVDKSDYTRTIYNCFINSKFDKEQLEKDGRLTNRQFNQLDLFPTILQSIGLNSSDKAGLGTSLASGEKTLVETKGFKWYENQANLQSDTYDELISGTNNEDVGDVKEVLDVGGDEESDIQNIQIKLNEPYNFFESVSKKLIKAK